MSATGLTLLGVLVLEREPLRLAAWDSYLRNWVTDAGGFAAVGLFFWLLLHTIYTVRFKEGSPATRPPLPTWLFATLALGLYIAAGVFAGIDILTADADLPRPDQTPPGQEAPPQTIRPPTAAAVMAERLALAAGACALIAIVLPFLIDAVRLRPGRIYALAKLSYKEAVRRRVLWVFLAFLLVFLFPPKWFFPIKPEDEIRANVSVIYWAMTPLLLLTAGMLAAFSIPNDIKSQTLHTIVTKPVERFEIVLGRFLGYSALLTLVLFGLCSFSLVLIYATRVSDEAKAESFTARVPIFGHLSFRNLANPGAEFKGESVGREWDYRNYIAGGPRSTHRADWSFTDEDMGRAGRGLANMPSVPCEFAFDIFRTTKGEEGKGVDVSFTFVTWQAMSTPNPEEAYEKQAAGLFINAQPGDPDWERINQLAEQTGTYLYRSKTIADYHLFSIELPAGLFKNAYAGDPQPIRYPDGTVATPPRVLCRVKCETRTQFIGVARHDLYLLADTQPFWLNFFKGALGLWMRLLLVIGLAVAMSTYLSGVIAWLGTMFLFSTGLFLEFIEELAKGANVGGGPFVAAIRLVRNDPVAASVDDSPAASLAQGADIGFRWVLRRLINAIPDVDRFDWSVYVAEGFNIGPGEVLVNGLMLIGYLMPWALLGYYLMKTREVAA